MPPEQLPEDNNVELEAIAKNGLESNEKLDGIEANTGASAIKLDEVASNTEAGVLATTKLQDPLERIAENTAKPSITTINVGQRQDPDDVDFNENKAGQALWSMLRGPKGKTPVKGEDYMTEDEVNQIKAEVTPKKGVDYYTPEEVNQIKAEVTPKKGVDYTDGIEGKPGVDGRNPLTASRKPPKNPQIGDLWYKI